MTRGPAAAGPAIASSSTELLTRNGRFRAVAFRTPSGVEHIAVVLGDPRHLDRPLVRIQSSCLTSTALGAVTCDCAAQLDLSLRLVREAQVGVILYLSQEGMGHGLTEKLAQMSDAAAGVNVIERLKARGIAVDLRKYGDAAAILHSIVGRRAIRLLTNNPEKLRRVAESGIQVAERVALEVEPYEEVRAYLVFKKVVLGHLLSKV